MVLTEEQRELICEYLEITLSFMKFPGTNENLFDVLAENITEETDDIFEGSDIIKMITDSVYEDSHDWDLDNATEEEYDSVEEDGEDEDIPKKTNPLLIKKQTKLNPMSDYDLLNI